MVYKWINFIQNQLAPPRCLICGDPGFERMDICELCLSELPCNHTQCQRCGLPLSRPDGLCPGCLLNPPDYRVRLAPFLFEEPISRLINHLKFHNGLTQARLLSTLLLRAIRTQGIDIPDTLIPVPLHPRRMRQRGYNQALELAKPIARQLKIDIDTYSCKRIRDTQAQSGLGQGARKKNIKGAFSLSGQWRGRHIALLDDVITTGSTMDEITRLLLRAGAERIDAWAVARTATKS